MGFVTDESDFGPMGVVTGGDAFELQKSSQVVFNVSGKCTSARDCNLTTILEYLSTGASPLTISSTQVTSASPCGFANGASLRLPAGKYRWTTRIARNTGGDMTGANLEVASKRIYDDMVDPNVVGQCSVDGTSDGFVTVSLPRELAVMARANISGSLPPGEQLVGALRISDSSNNSAVTTPRCILLGPNPRALETEATPIYLQPGRLYRVSYDMIHGSQATMFGAVTVSAG